MIHLLALVILLPEYGTFDTSDYTERIVSHYVEIYLTKVLFIPMDRR